MINSTNSLSP